MSLAEDQRRLFASGEPLPATRSAPTRHAQPRLRAVPPSLVAGDAGTRNSEPISDARLSSDASLELLDRAAKGVLLLLDRCKQLEDHLRQLDAWSKAQIETAQSTSRRWQQAAAANEQKSSVLQKTVLEMTQRAEAAERTLLRDKDALARLQDRVAAAFGLGSEADDAIRAMGLPLGNSPAALREVTPSIAAIPG